MTIEEIDKKIAEFQGRINNLAVQLVSQHPEGARLIGKVELLGEMKRDQEASAPAGGEDG